MSVDCTNYNCAFLTRHRDIDGGHPEGVQQPEGHRGHRGEHTLAVEGALARQLNMILNLIEYGMFG